ncbi:MAG: T9SS type A sorting domain-containing protein [Ignavibacteriaceae bacterium]|nr:T9SS type A sorting domain-containing protein [Ignavibacteriaceae bacterium]
MNQTKRLFAVLLLIGAIAVNAQVPLYDNMPANGVLGQTDFTTLTAGLTASTLNTPKGVAIDPTTGKLFVADYENRRVLRWSSVDKMINGASAEAVLGEPDFTSNTGGTSASLMSRPYGIHVDAAGRLWVADLSNARVLCFYNASTITSGSPANKVLGQTDFATGTINTGGVSASTMNRPVGVFVDADGNLYVSDRDNRRVMIFKNAAAKDNGDPADVILGQPDVTSITDNTGGISASTMTRPYGCFVDAAGRLWVADRDNNRVLRFDNVATKTTGASADAVLGQSDFVSSVAGRTKSAIEGPRSVAVDGLGRLFVADEGNNRILVYNDAAAKPNGADADIVLGQPDFLTGGWPPVDPPTASSFNYPEFLWIDNSANHIWVADEYNNRILRFDAIVIPVELISFTGSVISNKVELNWSTATETNNDGFAIEKKSGDAWKQIGYVKGHGTTAQRQNYSFSENASSGKYSYRLKQIDFDGSFKYSNTVEVTVGLTPGDYQLSQNYPNPFNPTTTIKFAVQNTEHVTVTVHNALGREVERLFDGIANADEQYLLTFDAKNLSSGVYFYSIRSESMNEVKKMSLMK